MRDGALRLHGFFNSSASYRVRIALNLKGLAWEHVGVNIRSGVQNAEAYKSINPGRVVPTLEVEGRHVTQSLAIIDFLDRLQPKPLLIPISGPERDRVLEIALVVACDIHPLNNLRVLRHLTATMALAEAGKSDWVKHWIGLGFDAIEALLAENSEWCVGASPTLADCCLVPQVANARRAGVELSAWPRIRAIDARGRKHPAFQAAEPEHQPDFVAA